MTWHHAWMLRASAIGLGAGTQVLTQMARSVIISVPTELSIALLMGAGWVIDLAVAEGAIRKHLGPTWQPAIRIAPEGPTADRPPAWTGSE